MSIEQIKLDGHSKSPVPERLSVEITGGMVKGAYKEVLQNNEVDTEASISYEEAKIRAVKGKVGEIALRQLYPRCRIYDGWKADIEGPGSVMVEVKTVHVTPFREGDYDLFVPDRHDNELFADYYVLMELVKRNGEKARDAYINVVGYAPVWKLEEKAERITPRSDRFDKEGWLLNRSHLEYPDPDFFPPKGDSQ